MVAVSSLGVVTLTSVGFEGRVPVVSSIGVGMGVPGSGSSDSSVVVKVISPW